MKYELEIISDVLSNHQKPKVLKKNDRIRKLFDLDNVELEEYIDQKTGKHIKKYSAIYHNNAYYKINKPYDELRELILNRTLTIQGFAYKSKKYK